MTLTVKSFFSNYILHPCTLPTPEERRIATIASIACGILSLGLIHAACALIQCLKNRNIADQTESEQGSKASQAFLKTKPKTTPPQNILDLIEKRIEQVKAPTNALECLIYTGMQQEGKSAYKKNTGITNELLWNDWKKCNDTTDGLSGAGLNALFDAHFNSKSDRASMNPSTGAYLGNQTPSLVYCTMTNMSEDSTQVAKNVKTILQNEKKSNPKHRPDKIFIPLFWNKKGTVHFTLLVVEPKKNPAQITMINTNGNDVTHFHDYEIAAIKAAKEVYPDASFARNTETLWATGTSCAYDVVDIALSLAKAPNAQEVITKKLWRCRTVEEDRIRRQVHTEALARFFMAYSK